MAIFDKSNVLILIQKMLFCHNEISLKMKELNKEIDSEFSKKIKFGIVFMLEIQ